MLATLNWMRSYLGWPQGWVSDMSNSPTRSNPRVGQKFLSDGSGRVLAIVRRSKPTREIVRNLRLDKIKFLHHQAVPIIKPSSPCRSHQAVLTKPSSSSSSAHHQAILSSDRSKPTYQVNLSSHLIKPSYQVILSSDRSKHTLGSCYDRLLRSLATVACYGRFWVLATAW
jgi:hypothetical protein